MERNHLTDGAIIIKLLVGNAHGMEFTSPGPDVRYIKDGR